MPQPHLPADAIGLPITRDQVERAIDALVDLLDTFEPDPDLEPELGWQSPHGYLGESTNQAGPDFRGGSDDREGYDEREDVGDSEPSLGWTSNENQASANYHAATYGDNEDGTGPVRKHRPKSKTGGDIYRGTAVLGLDEPPQNAGTFTMPMARPKRRWVR